MPTSPITVAWISDYPLEWMDGLPSSLRGLPRLHPATWMAVLLAEIEKDPSIRLHVLVLRKGIGRDERFEQRGVTFHVLKVPGGWRAPSFFWVDTQVIRRALRVIQPDVVHAWGTERGAAAVASRLPWPYLVTIQGLLTWYRELLPLSRYERFAAFMESFSLKRSLTVTTESVFAVNFLKRHYPHLRVEQVEHASNWIFHRLERQPQTRPLRFLTVGTLAYRKGSDLLLKALNELSPELDFELVLVGGKPNEWVESLRPGLRPEFWNRIRFEANLPPARVAEEISRATLLVLPTRADTSPNAVKEAVVAGLPVVASRIGGIPDYVFPDKNGLLFDSENLPQLIDCLRGAARHPLFGLGRVDAKTLAETRAYLSPALMKRRFEEIYRSLLGVSPDKLFAQT